MNPNSTLWKFQSIDPCISYSGVGRDYLTLSLVQSFIGDPHNPSLPSKLNQMFAFEHPLGFPPTND
ncbi:hypothetical protein HKD37_07G019247 [Glycine soja]